MESKLTRRDLLASSTVLLLFIPVASAMTACGSSDTPSGNGNGCDGVFSTSSVTNSHTHTVCVASSDLSSPQASGATYTTSTDLNHNHTVQLTQAQLQSINGGASVTVRSSEPAAHDFVIKKA